MCQIDFLQVQCLFRKYIMNTEFVVDINGIPAKAYMQIGFSTMEIFLTHCTSTFFAKYISF